MAKKISYTFEGEKFELKLKNEDADKLIWTVKNSSAGHLYEDFKVEEIDVINTVNVDDSAEEVEEN